MVMISQLVEHVPLLRISQCSNIFQSTYMSSFMFNQTNIKNRYEDVIIVSMQMQPSMLPNVSARGRTRSKNWNMENWKNSDNVTVKILSLLVVFV